MTFLNLQQSKALGSSSRHVIQRKYRAQSQERHSSNISYERGLASILIIHALQNPYLYDAYKDTRSFLQASKTSASCWYRLSDVHTELLSSFKVLGNFPFLLQTQCNRTHGNPQNLTRETKSNMPIHLTVISQTWFTYSFSVVSRQIITILVLMFRFRNFYHKIRVLGMK